MSDYTIIKTALPKEFEWEDYGNGNVEWDKFIIEEMDNFSYFLSQMLKAYGEG